MPQTLAGPILSAAHGCYLVGGRFAPDTANPPTYPDTQHPGWSVARAGVGLFDVTLTDKRWAHLLCAGGTIQLNAVANSSVQLVSITAPTATAYGKFRLRVETAAAEADVAANANNQIHWWALVSENEKLA